MRFLHLESPRQTRACAHAAGHCGPLEVRHVPVLPLQSSVSWRQ